jgi:hypothetical protein
MELLVLIDKLDDLMQGARAVPLTDQVRVDKEEVYDILDQLRAAIPESVKRAEVITQRQEAAQELRVTVLDAIRECIPEIAAAVAAAGSGRSGSGTSPPGGPF